jgi:hypothetical protein
LEQLSATDVASFVRLQLCRRYLAFQAGRGKEKVEEVQKRFRILADPAYQEVGLRSVVSRILWVKHGGRNGRRGA